MLAPSIGWIFPTPLLRLWELIRLLSKSIFLLSRPPPLAVRDGDLGSPGTVWLWVGGKAALAVAVAVSANEIP